MVMIGFSVKLDKSHEDKLNEYMLKKGLNSRSEAIRMMIRDNSSTIESTALSEDKILKEEQEELKTYLRKQQELEDRLAVETLLGLSIEKEDEYYAFYEKLVKAKLLPWIRSEVDRMGMPVFEAMNLMLSKFKNQHQEDCEKINRLNLENQKSKAAIRERDGIIARIPDCESCKVAHAPTVAEQWLLDTMRRRREQEERWEQERRQEREERRRKEGN
jgi:metal-responsive CopG/Arc/MetJ family transcriptional regulator